MISASAVTKWYGATRALWEVDLEVARGETVVLFGPNGSGKTTLLKICAGLARPTQGRVTIGGREPREARGCIGYLGHEPHLYPYLSAGENLRFFARLYGVADGRPAKLLDQVGLVRKRDALAHTLSAGELQRLGVARCLLHHPEVVLADEPFSNLDESWAARLPELLRGEGRTLLLATHDAGRAKAMADRIVAIDEGRLIP